VRSAETTDAWCFAEPEARGRWAGGTAVRAGVLQLVDSEPERCASKMGKDAQALAPPPRRNPRAWGSRGSRPCFPPFATAHRALDFSRQKSVQLRDSNQVPLLLLLSST
jgi:hypothetical protein